MATRFTPEGAQFQETEAGDRFTPTGEMLADGAAPAPDSPGPDSPGPDSPGPDSPGPPVYPAYLFLFGG